MSLHRKLILLQELTEKDLKSIKLNKFVSTFDKDEYAAQNPSFTTLSEDLDQLGKWDKDIATMRLEKNVAPLLLGRSKL